MSQGTSSCPHKGQGQTLLSSSTSCPSNVNWHNQTLLSSSTSRPSNVNRHNQIEETEETEVKDVYKHYFHLETTLHPLNFLKPLMPYSTFPHPSPMSCPYLVPFLPLSCPLPVTSSLPWNLELNHEALGIVQFCLNAPFIFCSLFIFWNLPLILLSSFPRSYM